MPISMGKLEGRKRELVEFGLEAHDWTIGKLKSGIVSATIAREYIDLFKRKGYGENYLYGPCHGLGMIEAEPPWMETNSEYLLEPNMTFQVDTFVSTATFGIRWETGVVINETGCDILSTPLGTIHEVGV